MDFANNLILVGAGLVVLSILAGLVSSRIGAPLLLVFLALGMLAGEDGLGIEFDDFQLTYVVGSIALAVILFDGGLRTSRASLRLALWPSVTLATLGVVITAALTGTAAAWLLGLTWLEGMLVGSIIASTDAAAVFFLLHLHGTGLKQRVSAALEVESGLNDPMAVFLTLACIEMLTIGAPELSWAALGSFVTDFAVQMAGGAVIGIGGGYVLLWLVNRLDVAPGLYPILAVSLALLIFAGAQNAQASGFLAVYLAGLVLGNHRHRATHLINRFHDGLAWLSQIVMFLMLGLLVTPSALLPMLLPALGIAVFLILVGRPLAVLVCLLPFRFDRQERLFISWVGLRGAVPIFLGTMPVLAGIEGAETFFIIAYVVVLTSLVVQGWTVTPAAGLLNLALPPQPEIAQRLDFDLPGEADRDLAAYRVEPNSLVVDRSARRLPLPPGASVMSIIRDGVMRTPAQLGRLAPGDHVFLLLPPEHAAAVDRLFAPPAQGDRGGRGSGALGEFAFDGKLAVGAVAGFYNFPVSEEDAETPLGEFLARRLTGTVVIGDRLRIGDVELVVRALEEGAISSVGIELEPRQWSLRQFRELWPATKARIATLRARLRRGGRAL